MPVNVNNKGEHEVDLRRKLKESLGDEYVEGTEVDSNARVLEMLNTTAKRNSQIKKVSEQGLESEGGPDLTTFMHSNNNDEEYVGHFITNDAKKQSKLQKMLKSVNVGKVIKGAVAVGTTVDLGSKNKNLCKYGVGIVTDFLVDATAPTEYNNPEGKNVRKMIRKNIIKEAGKSALIKTGVRGGFAVAKHYVDDAITNENGEVLMNTEAASVLLGDLTCDAIKVGRLAKMNKGTKVDPFTREAFKSSMNNGITYGLQSVVVAKDVVKTVVHSRKISDLTKDDTPAVLFEEIPVDPKPVVKKIPTVQEMKAPTKPEAKPGMVKKPSIKK